MPGVIYYGLSTNLAISRGGMRYDRDSRKTYGRATRAGIAGLIFTVVSLSMSTRLLRTGREGVSEGSLPYGNQLAVLKIPTRHFPPARLVADVGRFGYRCCIQVHRYTCRLVIVIKRLRFDNNTEYAKVPELQAESNNVDMWTCKFRKDEVKCCSAIECRVRVGLVQWHQICAIACCHPLSCGKVIHYNGYDETVCHSLAGSS
jgi:hypothetical protein